MTEKRGRFLAVVRVRGRVGVSEEIRTALRVLNLHRPNHGVIVEESPPMMGALQKTKDYVTWGEISKDTLALLLKKRGRLGGGERVTDATVKEKLGCESVEGLAERVWTGEIAFSDIPSLDRVFRLHPPRGGFKRSKKRPYPEGELGYRSSSMDELISRMA
jgi:large subunit ribosomal protein L30